MERSWKDYNKDLVKRVEILSKIKQKSPLQANAIHYRHTKRRLPI
ncbi:MAG: hypothetical protein RMK75_06725 [Aquificaceae bacterium]|nr:hypothetical protein [Aquificaceae bacterium]MDW8423996.1 hypothetical protein [Aquificaceae bacterium]